MGTDERPESENDGSCLSTSSRSRDSSLSTEGIIARQCSGTEECCVECTQIKRMANKRTSRNG